MKIVLTLILFLTANASNAQPCKQIEPGMKKTQVLKLVGTPTEIDTIPAEFITDSILDITTVWQYGDVMKYGHQRIEFSGDIVTNVIADGKRFDELLKSFQCGEFPENELMMRIKKLNAEYCK